jgi:hypothetical protein
MAINQSDTSAAPPGKQRLPDIKWGSDNGKLTWQLIKQIENKENHHVFLGKAEKTDVRRLSTCFLFLHMCLA